MEKHGWEGLNPAREVNGVWQVLSTEEQHREMAATRPMNEDQAKSQAGVHLNKDVATDQGVEAKDSERKFGPNGKPEGLEVK